MTLLADRPVCLLHGYIRFSVCFLWRIRARVIKARPQLEGLF